MKMYDFKGKKYIIKGAEVEMLGDWTTEEAEKLANNLTNNVEEKPKEEGKIKKLWNKTTIKDWIDKKKEQKNLESDIKHKAKIQAIRESELGLIEAYKKEEITKATDKKSGFWGKVSKGFENAGKNLGNMDMGRNMGDNFGSLGNNDRIGSMLGGKQQEEEEEYEYVEVPKKKKTKVVKTKNSGRIIRRVKRKPKEESYEDKLKRMLK